MNRLVNGRRTRAAAAVCAGLVVALAGPALAQATGTSYSVGPITDISASCSGQNAEVEQASDPTLGYVYETWMGCKGIAFARSTDGGRTFGTPISVPGSVGSNVNTWDPAIAVAPDGTVYSSFMIAKGSQWYPVVAASSDHGASFSQVSSLLPLRHLGLRPGTDIGDVPVRGQRKLRLRDRGSQRCHPEVGRWREDLERDVLYQSRIPGQRR